MPSTARLIALAALLFVAAAARPASAQRIPDAPPPAPWTAPDSTARPAYQTAARTGHDASASMVPTLVLGAFGGVGLAVAYINPPGEGWLVSDGAAIPLAMGAGLAAGLLVHGSAPRIGAARGEWPRLHLAAGTGGDMDVDYSLAYRAPLRDRLDVEGALIVMSHSWERVERETRCGMIIGCITGDFVVDHRYRQNVALVARGIYHLRPDGAWRPTVAVGAGPVVAHLEARDLAPVTSAGTVVDGALAIERGDRTRWSAETGYRLVLIGGGGEAGRAMSGPYVRLGLGLAARGGEAPTDARLPRPAPVAAHTPAPARAHATDGRTWSLAATALPILAGVAMAGAGVGDGSRTGTAMNASLIWGGALVGPAAGYFRTGRTARGLQGIALRSALFAAAWALAPTRDFDDGFLPNPSWDDARIWLVAAPAIIVLDVVDILGAVTAPSP